MAKAHFIIEETKKDCYTSLSGKAGNGTQAWVTEDVSGFRWMHLYEEDKQKIP